MSISRPPPPFKVILISSVGGGRHRRLPGFPARVLPNRRGHHRPGVAALSTHESRRYARRELRRGACDDLPLRQGDERRDRPRGDEAEAAGLSVVALAGGGVFRPRGLFRGVCGGRGPCFCFF